MVRVLAILAPRHAVSLEDRYDHDKLRAFGENGSQYSVQSPAPKAQLGFPHVHTPTFLDEQSSPRRQAGQHGSSND